MVRTDQQSLRHVMLQREINSEYQKWVRKLMGYDFEVKYKPRISNRVTDALSRKVKTEVVCGALVTSVGVYWDELATKIK